MTYKLGIILVAVAVLISGCYPIQDPEKAPLEKTNVVHISNNSYYPPRIQVSPEQTVTWINEDAVVHTVTSQYFNSGPLATGQTFSYRFNQPGKYNYHCAYNPLRIKGIVEVRSISLSGK